MMLKTLTTVLMVAAAGSLLNAQAADTKPRTVWDGVYTDAQAARATATFSQSCSNCHTLAQDGGNRPLTGDAFWKGFTQKTVADLLTFVKTNMPNGVNAGSLPAPDVQRPRRPDSEVQRVPGRHHGSVARQRGRRTDHPEGRRPASCPRTSSSRVVGCLSKSGADWVLTSATAPGAHRAHGPRPERRQPAAGNAVHDPEVRADAAGSLCRPADVGQRDADRGRRAPTAST